MPFIKLIPTGSEEIKKADDVSVEPLTDIVPDVPPDPPYVPSARAAAASAISEFQKLPFDLTAEQAREAYARLLVGRGFNRQSAAAQAEEAARAAAVKKSEPDNGGRS